MGKAKGILKNFLIEPFVPHKQVKHNLYISLQHQDTSGDWRLFPTKRFSIQEEEFYVCIYATREGDYVLFHHEGGVDVGDVDAKAKKLLIGVSEKISEDLVKKELLTHAPNDKKEWVCRASAFSFSDEAAVRNRKWSEYKCSSHAV